MTGRGKSLLRAALLVALVILLSPLNSELGPLVVIGIPAAAAILAFEPLRASTAGLALLMLATAVVGFNGGSPLWHFERGWALLLAGGFVASTMLLPDRPAIDRSLLAVGIAGSVVGATGWLRPEALAEVDWHISAQFDRALALYDVEMFGGPEARMLAARAVGWFKILYPATLALASMAALGAAVYMLGRIRGEDAPIPPLRHLRFSDHLAWLLVIGLVLVVLPAGSAAARLGGNMAVVMSGLYILRGLAVLAWLVSSLVSSGWPAVVLAILGLFLAPLTMAATLVIGLCDTWLNLRARLSMNAAGR